MAAAKKRFRRAVVNRFMPEAVSEGAQEYLETGSEPENFRQWLARAAELLEAAVLRERSVERAAIISFAQANPGFSKAQILQAVNQGQHRAVDDDE